jgi:hypothetical protein
MRANLTNPLRPRSLRTSVGEEGPRYSNISAMPPGITPTLRPDGGIRRWCRGGGDLRGESWRRSSCRLGDSLGAVEVMKSSGEGRDLGDDVEDGHVEDAIGSQEMEVLASDPLVEELLWGVRRDGGREGHMNRLRDGEPAVGLHGVDRGSGGVVGGIDDHPEGGREGEGAS